VSFPRPLSLMAAVCVAALPNLTSSCVAAKEARLGAEELVQPRVVERISAYGGGGPVEIRCGTGEVCSEVRVVHVERDRAGGVSVTLENRTEAHVAVQLAIEGFDGAKRRTDRTGFHDVIIAPRGDSVIDLDTAAAVDDMLVLHVRARSS